MERKFMKLAISLAEKGTGKVNPNPLVGAVIVKNGEITGTGYHQKYGGLHAERNALKNCTDAEGATMYVTLTPCCHTGKTPPCTEALIESGIKKVVIGSRDPNPLVGEKSIKILRNAGIEVVEDFMKKECDALNPVFFKYISTRRPYVVMKFAETLDGKIATSTMESRWITGEKAREHVHNSRSKYTGIMVGVNTVLKDNPLLNCRAEGGRNPVRIVCDTSLRTPLTSRLVATADTYPLIIATAVTDENRIKPYLERHCTILKLNKGSDSHIDLNQLMTELGKRNIDSILLEGGSALHGSALAAGIVDKVEAYIAPKIFGGKEAPSPVGGNGVLHPSDAIILEKVRITQLGEDILIEGDVRKCSQE